MKKGVVSLVAAVVVSAVAVAGVSYMSFGTLSSRHGKTQLLIDSNSKTYGETYDARLRDNAEAEAYNDEVLEAMKVAEATPGNKDKGENSQPSQPYFEEGRDGIWIYDIQDGDTLIKISKLTGFSVDELAEFNKIRDVNLIYSQSVLRIPPWSASYDELREAGFRSRVSAVEHG